jgi:5-oxoprolinase (ATP-hydrolysing)
MERAHPLILKMPSAITLPPTLLKAGIEIAIDRGGTFCDCLATNIPGKEDIVVKLLSVDPSNYDDAPTVSHAREISAAF